MDVAGVRQRGLLRLADPRRAPVCESLRSLPAAGDENMSTLLLGQRCGGPKAAVAPSSPRACLNVGCDVKVCIVV